MRQYIITIFLTLAIAGVIERTYVVSPDSLGTRNKNRICYFLIFAILSIFIGMRTSYNDTYVYITGYEKAKPISEIWGSIDFRLGANPGFVLTNALLKTCHVSEQGFVLFYSILAVGSSIYFLRKYSNAITLSLFLFFATNSYTICAAAVKQVTAMSLAFFAIAFVLRKKWVPFVLLLILAATFHPYVLIYLLIPCLTFKPWSKWTYVFLGAFVAAGFALESLLGSIVDLTAMLGDTYSEEELVGEGISIFRVLVSNVPLFLTFVYRRQLFQTSSREDHLMVNLAMLNGAIMFVGLFGTAIYFSRMASFFTIAQCVALPWCIGKFPPVQRRTYTWLMIVGYICFFVYANILAVPFDDSFRRISFFEYLFG